MTPQEIWAIVYFSLSGVVFTVYFALFIYRWNGFQYRNDSKLLLTQEQEKQTLYQLRKHGIVFSRYDKTIDHLHGKLTSKEVRDQYERGVNFLDYNNFSYYYIYWLGGFDAHVSTSTKLDEALALEESSEGRIKKKNTKKKNSEKQNNKALIVSSVPEQENPKSSAHSISNNKKKLTFQSHSMSIHVFLFFSSLVVLIGSISTHPLLAIKFFTNVEVSAYDVASFLIYSTQTTIFIYLFVSKTMPIFLASMNRETIAENSRINSLTLLSWLKTWDQIFPYWAFTFIVTICLLISTIGNADHIPRPQSNQFLIQSYPSFAGYLLFSFALFLFLLYQFFIMWKYYRITLTFAYRYRNGMKKNKNKKKSLKRGSVEEANVFSDVDPNEPTPPKKISKYVKLIKTVYGNQWGIPLLGFFLHFVQSCALLLLFVYQSALFVFFYIKKNYGFTNEPPFSIDSFTLDLIVNVTTFLFNVYSLILFISNYRKEINIFNRWEERRASWRNRKNISEKEDDEKKENDKKKKQVPDVNQLESRIIKIGLTGIDTWKSLNSVLISK